MTGFFLQAILLLGSVSSAEELDEQTVERFEALRRHPIAINQASAGRLQSSGLFTPYQVASIVDYRSHSGDILSYTELGLIDGIGPDMAEALKEYTHLESRAAPGSREWQKLSGSASAGYGSGGYRVKGSFGYGESLEVNLSSRQTDYFNGSAAWYGKRWLGKVVAGSFNARFGQGLTLWSGTSRSGFYSVDALSRKATGTAPSTSTSTSNALQGVAADFIAGKWTLSAMGWMKFEKKVLSIAGAAYAERMWRDGQISFGGVFGAKDKTVGADFRWHSGSLDYFGEAAWDIAGKAPAAVFGIRGDPQYRVCWSVLARYYSPKFKGKWSAGAGSTTKTSDETGLTAAGRYKWLDFTADAAWHAEKGSFGTRGMVSASPEFKARGLDIKPRMRAVARYRSADACKWRTELRGECLVSYGVWQANARADAVWCRDFAWQWLIEAGYADERFKLWLCGSLFKVDNWDDRIYVYQRDIPGHYNVPARYGRGWTVSLVGGAKLGRRPRHRIDMRAGAVLHPWGDGKASTFEWRLQYAVDF